MLRSKRDLKLLSTQVQREPNLVGTWVNELGSRMQIDSVDDGLITGTYWSKVSAEQDPVCGNLTGMVAGDTIGFAVNWQPTFDSVTSWSGKLLATDQGYPYIFTLWTPVARRRRRLRLVAIVPVRFRHVLAGAGRGGGPKAGLGTRRTRHKHHIRNNAENPRKGRRRVVALVGENNLLFVPLIYLRRPRSGH